MKKTKILDILIVSFMFAIAIFVVYILVNNKDDENIDNSFLTLILDGSEEYNIVKGKSFVEPGYIAYDSIDGNITDKVVITGSVDSEVAGTYELIYSVTNSKNETVSKVRIVNIILDFTDLKFNYDYTPKEMTNSEVLLKINISGDGYDYLEDFNGVSSRAGEIEYKINKNDKYNFKIRLKNGEVLEKSIEINNIDQKKPTGSCINTIINGKSKISVTATDENGIKGYDYKLSGEVKSSNINNVYQYDKLSLNASVIVYDKAGNNQELSCKVVHDVGAWPKDKKRAMIQTSNNYYYEGKYGNNNNYILYYPNTIDLKEKNALVIYLGGGGEIGSNIGLIQGTHFGSNMKKGVFQGAVYLLPQCRSGWEYCFTSLKILIDETVRKYNIDSTRVSIMGHSHGAVSTYQMIGLYPRFFSAAVVLSGHYEKKVSPDALKGIKIMAYYGDKDSNITAGRIRTKYLIEQGVNLKYVEFANEGHTIQDRVINGTDAIEWLIAQKRA